MREPEHRGFVGRGRIAHIEPRDEPIELRLGQRIRALVLDRVLGRDHEERLG